MYVIGNPILNDAKCVILLAFPPYTIVDSRSFRLYIYRRRKRNGSTGRTNSAKGPRVRAHKAAISTPSPLPAYIPHFQTEKWYRQPQPSARNAFCQNLETKFICDFRQAMLSISSTPGRVLRNLASIWIG